MAIQSDDVVKFLGLLHPEGIYEIRSPKCPEWKGGKQSTFAGWFTDHQAAAAAIKQLESLEPPAIYVTLNPCDPSLVGRGHNKLKPTRSSTAKDNIVRRTTFMVDIDPVRLSDTNSTDEQMQAALELAQRIKAELSAEGWTDPLEGMSGNGAYLLYRIDLPNDGESEQLIQDCLVALTERFSDKQSHVDTSTFDANRICKVLGTMARKGDHIVGVPGVPDMPQRRSYFLPNDAPLAPVPMEMLATLAAQRKPEEKPQVQSSGSRASSFSLENWIREFNIPVGKPISYAGGRKWIFNELPLPCQSSPSGHSCDGSGWLIERSTGVIQAGCRHERCNWDWKDLRVCHEPDAYDRPESSPGTEQYVTNELQKTAAQSDNQANHAPPTSAEISQPLGANPQNSREIGGYRHRHKDEGPSFEPPERQDFEPFPTDVFPSDIAAYIQHAAKSICCDESFVALPMLAGLAAAIGNSNALLIKFGWSAPPIVWTALVAPSGAGKSAPQRHALRPIYQRQKRLLKEYDTAMEKFQREQEIYLRDLADFKKSKDGAGEPPVPPTTPVCPRVVVNDITIEALGKKLQENDKGLLCANDELSGWLSSFNRYKKGSSSDEAKWLEFHSAQTSVIDRSSSARPLVIDRAAVCVTGTIQPGILKKQLSSDHKASGLAARLLFAMPPVRVKQWSDHEIPEDLSDRVASIFDALFGLEMRQDKEGNPQPNYVRLEENARELFVRYFNRHNKEQQALNNDDLIAAYSKLEEYAARFALVVHCAQWATNPWSSPIGELTVDSMTAGIRLCEWFKNEAKRVYSVLSEDDAVSENRKVLNWCARQGGPVTGYQVYRSHRKLGSTENAERLLQQFIDAGYGNWEKHLPDDRGGKPTRGFRFYGDGANPIKAQGKARLAPSDSENSTTAGESWNANWLIKKRTGGPHL